MSAVDELVDALTDAGLTWGKPAVIGAPELRVRAQDGREIVVRVLRFSYMVTDLRSSLVYQCLTAGDVLGVVRGTLRR